MDPPVVLASLSGESDATWAQAGAPYAGLAMLGGIAIDESTRAAARELVARDRTEFLPADPVAFVDDQFEKLETVQIRPGINVRTTSTEPLERLAGVCADHDAVLELNAHCRQDEMCAAGAGERLLRDTDRLATYVRQATREAPTVGVKVRAELSGVDLVEVAQAVENASGDFVHVDAMDSEEVIRPIAAATDLTVIANNGVRDWETVVEYLEYGADAVSVGRPSDNPAVLERVHRAATRWFQNEAKAVGSDPP
ncbi:tRNA-dihydrouridine synthase [Halovenus marina]|uniref:tRNA-dihydrouridine synthase n=1 Tax=Halovenus marina TaxID=3396621 RepID=UPI003F555704